MVRVFTEGMQQIAVHAQHEPGQFSTRPQHIHSRKISSVERGTAWLLRRADLLGPNAERWGRAMLQARGIQGVRVLVGLLSLTRRYRPEQIDRACQIALTHEAFRLRVIRELIRRGGAAQEEFEYLASHEIIRDLTDYGELVTAAFRREPLLPATFEEEGGS
jgi:hypothetical protein